MLHLVDSPVVVHGMVHRVSIEIVLLVSTSEQPVVRLVEDETMRCSTQSLSLHPEDEAVE